MINASLMFQFQDEAQAQLASETLEELGYEPKLHGEGRLHIHVENEDITSALEIVQCYSGQLMEHTPSEIVNLTDLAYGMDSIKIPAHTINEDWVDHYRGAGHTSDPDEQLPYTTDDGSYDHFEAR